MKIIKEFDLRHVGARRHIVIEANVRKSSALDSAKKVATVVLSRKGPCCPDGASFSNTGGNVEKRMNRERAR